jgi:nitrite reductase/ring-hydroxylating ferredoxin subunit
MSSISSSSTTRVSEPAAKRDRRTLPAEDRWYRAATLAELEASGVKTVSLDGRTLVLWRSDGRVYALDNRCPHMGFPLDRGTCARGILTCHWHSARFDMRTGGTFDQFADDMQVFPVEIRGEDIWVNTASQRDMRTYYRTRLHDGLEQNIRLILAKSAIALVSGEGTEGESREPFCTGVEFGTRNRAMGWGQGLTMLTCLANLLPHLDTEDRPRALYHGLDAVARETAGAAPRFVLKPLPGAPPDVSTLKQWFRQFLEVRDEEGAERVLVSAVHAGVSSVDLADMLFAAATDHHYISIGHALDFTNKACEALDLAGWESSRAELVLGSVVRGIAAGTRQEESNAWRHPIDLVVILDGAFSQLEAAVADGLRHRGTWNGETALSNLLLLDSPQQSVDALLQALREGATEEQVAAAVSYAAALRIARFHTSNEFGDWDTTLHTFSFAHAVHMGLRRLCHTQAPRAEAGPPALLRGAFDAAMSVYLDRFLNIPAASIPQPDGIRRDGKRSDALLHDFLALLDRQQQVNEAGALVAHYLAAGGDDRRLLATLGKALLREDRDFHTIQTMEIAVREYELRRGTQGAAHFLIAAARYLAAHAPTARAQGQTYTIALRLHRGEQIYEGASTP